MFEKSLIQQHIEWVKAKHELEAKITNIIENYRFDNLIFDFRGKPVTGGYFLENTIFDNLEEAINDMDVCDILLINEDGYMVGKLYDSSSLDLMEDVEKIIDLNTMEKIIF